MLQRLAVTSKHWISRKYAVEVYGRSQTVSDLNGGSGSYLGVEEDHSEVRKDVGHHGVLEEVEAVKKKVKSLRFTYNIIIFKT